MRLDKGELVARGCGEQGGDLEGPAVSASSPLCGSGIFFPHGTQGRFVQFSQFDSPPGGGERGMDKKENPRYRCYSKGEKPPPWARALFYPRLIGNYNLGGFCFSSRLLGRRRRRFSPVPQSQLSSSLRTPPGCSFSSFFLLVFLCCRRCLRRLRRRRHCLRCPGPAAAAESFSSGPSRVK